MNALFLSFARRPITFTFADFLYVCSAIAVVATAIVWIVKAVKTIKSPNDRQNERLSTLEKFEETAGTYFSNDNKRLQDLEAWRDRASDSIERHEQHLRSQDKRLRAIEEGNRATQRAVLAIMSYDIDGDKDRLRQAQKDFSEFLISTKTDDTTEVTK